MIEFLLSPIVMLCYLAFFVILSVYNEEYEGYWGTFLTASIVGYGVFLLSHFDMWLSWIWDNKLWSIGVIVCYFLIGSAYSLLRWGMYVSEKVTKLKRDYTSKGSLKAYLNSYAPKASMNKSLILWWIGYWPISFIWMLLSNPLVKICLAIYNRLGKYYDNITSSVIEKAS